MRLHGDIDDASLGIELIGQSECLSDILLASPPEWLDKPMLRYRMSDGSWKTLSRIRVQQSVLRVAAWLESKGIKPGDRVGILGHNCPEWFIADFAILRLGAITVPAYFTDASEAVSYVFQDADVSVIFVEEGQQLHKIEGLEIPHIPFHGKKESVQAIARDESWDNRLCSPCPDRQALATLIYTSGTTAHPKGVMLTHDNILSDVQAGLGGVPVYASDLFLSFLPLSHAFERTVGHFLPTSCGAEIAYAEDVTTLLRDMPEVHPTVMISVPRLYEKIYAGVKARMAESPIKQWLFDHAQALGQVRFEKRQAGSDLSGFSAFAWRVLDKLVNAKLREKMGGRIRAFVSGGAALHPDIARFLLAADITVLPGYGLSETSPVLTVNLERKIKPDTVGPALPGVELKVADDGELLVRGPMLMQGYWNRPDATNEVMDDDGWLYTGDIVNIDDDGYVKIIDRKKEILVLSNGENVPPAVVEQHLTQAPFIAQAMIVGDGRDYVVALVVPDVEGLRLSWKQEQQSELPDDWRRNEQIKTWILLRMHKEEHDLASFMQVQRFAFVDGEWTQDNGFLTPTLKLKRRVIAEAHQGIIEAMYHDPV
ncbi:MAG: long-chain fatty acid--CoA ligase [Zetaproteobacteria bacterium CG_4_9_14_3_um_filter_49_83]|nr:MAG: long-chain fatty acid--CoA ligase [Zetaproteobacteria bacterium CG1_02_49_23]PIQ34083.1 MAG: long-chain fatty acid--CoA ligase [Zetaproteobacteria bacterium CG17_big_fil_post_rev_8_21_14_2_50_50_13]PIV30240.1 MAG: long-chain fatty acid--CoA ligase [Zetaproteobacteria bacterium CG02_land_8_20_14_3_00_50_9]PIY55869.1 MAG: long-chain fatty acid--CoA ligase [Zetaproteobacteria bacterium CG_4_10_14_0_8_um_filter_49_80]PJA34999.1 MAG: long-chain fatty acid--CoA ligase [Zetaproteobacteria bact